MAHDLSVVRHVSNRVAVMYVGRMVELAETEALFSAPKHPYTAALLAAVPEPDPRTRSRRIVLQGEVANPASPPSGCYFHPRCPYAWDKCVTEEPPLLETGDPAHAARCWLVTEPGRRPAGPASRYVVPRRTGYGDTSVVAPNAVEPGSQRP